MHRTVMCLFTVCLLVPFARLSAQESPPLEPGQRVRVTDCGSAVTVANARGSTTRCPTLQGTLVTLTPDSIVLVADRTARVAVSLPSVTAVQVFAGRRTFNTTGGALGLVAGAGLASTVGIRSVSGVVFFGAVGAALGGGGKSTVKGAGRGLLIGALPGAAFGAWMSNQSSEGVLGCSGGCIAAWTVIMGGVGAGIGAIVGALTGTDRWEEVPLERIRVSFAPQRDGFAFGMWVVF